MSHRRGGPESSHGLSSLSLPASLADRLAEGHPWVYRDHVAPDFRAESGSFVHVRAGSFSGFALWDATSPIALRMFSRVAPPDQHWVAARVREALELRRELREQDTTAFRLLYGEGDGVPGVTVDVYDRYAVIVTYANALERVVPWVVAALENQLSLDGILLRRRTRAEEERISVLRGREPNEAVLVREYGVRFRADLHAGQKTGLFLDHRDNRAYVREHAAGKRVLNLFAYTGGFSVCAALGGASHVTSVDIAPQAIAAARQNFAENQLPAATHDAVASDVFEYLERARLEKRLFDLVICDPPSFASSREKQYAALRAYTRLNTLGLSVVAPGGTYAAASCTAQVSPEAFRATLAQAAARAGVRFQIVHDVGQPVDHPVFAGHPEGRYLKFVVGRILPIT
ncbi:MAG: class I SAM-dependent rRNA methyltransferase [Myxococcota bacterium]